MNNLVIDTDAGTGGKSAVAEKGRAGAAALDVMADDVVKMLGRHPLLHRFTRKKQRFSGDAARLLHNCNLSLIFQLYHKNYLPVSDAIASIVSFVVSLSSSCPCTIFSLPFFA